MSRSVRLWAPFVLSCLLGACGGGGGSSPAKPDQAPVVHALASGDVRMDGGVMHATVGATIVLDASGSTDADGDALGFAWTLTAHPAGSQIATSGSGSTLTWKPDVAGTYTYDVVVSDSKGGSTSQTVSITVDNQAPAAVVSVSATFAATPQQAASQAVIVGGSVAIDASATADPDGDPVDVTFELVKSPSSNAALQVSGRTARFSPDQLGDYVVRVRGTDGRGASFETDYPFNASDRAPISSVAVTPTFAATPVQMPSVPVTLGASIGLDATATTDPDGDAVDVTFELTKPAGSTAALSVNGRVAHFSPDVLGAYEVRVRGLDGRGASFETRYPFDANNRAPSPVTVATVNPVVADAGSTIVTTSVGYDVVVDSSASSDPDVVGGFLGRNWVLASVPAGSQATLQGGATATSIGLSPDMLGDYVLHLTVTDGQGAQSMRTVTVRANNRRPVAEVTSNATPESLPSAPSFRVPLGTQVTLRADTSTDADGDTLTDAWTIDSAPAGSHATLSSTTAATPLFVADVEGTYVFRLRVTDPKGAFSERTVTMDVGGHAPVAVADRGTVTVLVNTIAHASASLSFDEDGDALTYQWSIDGRPTGSHAVLGTSNAAAVDFTPDAAGVYALAVRVSDGHSTSIAYVNVRAMGAFQPAVALDFTPGVSHYSFALDRVVFAASAPNALRLVDPFTGARSTIAVPAPIKNFSVSPDGKLAAVLYEGAVSLVDLQAGTVLTTTSTSGSQTDALVTNAGIIYAIGQTNGQTVFVDPVVVIDGHAGARISQGVFNDYNGTFYGTQYGVLAPSLNKVFFISMGITPVNMNWFSFDPVHSQVTGAASTGQGWQYQIGWPLWMASDDSVVFNQSGTYFRSDTYAYAGRLDGVAIISSFSHSAHNQEAVLLEWAAGLALPTSYERFTGQFLFPDTPVPLPQIGGQQAYGLQIYHSASGAHVLLVQTGSNGIDGHGITGYALVAH